MSRSVFSADCPLRFILGLPSALPVTSLPPSPCLFLHPPAAPYLFLSSSLPACLTFSLRSSPPHRRRTSQSPGSPVVGRRKRRLHTSSEPPFRAPLSCFSKPRPSLAGCSYIFSGTPLDPGVIALRAAPSSRGPDGEVPRGVQSALRFHSSQRCERDPAQYHHWYVFACRPVPVIVIPGCISCLSRPCAASSSSIDDGSRAALVQAIIDDLSLLSKGSSSSKQCRLTTKGACGASCSTDPINLSASFQTQVEPSSQSRCLARNRVDRSLLPLVPIFPPFFQYLTRSRITPMPPTRPFGASPTLCFSFPTGGRRSCRRTSGAAMPLSSCSRCAHLPVVHIFLAY